MSYSMIFFVFVFVFFFVFFLFFYFKVFDLLIGFLVKKNFPKIYLATIWYAISWTKQFDVFMATVFDRHVFRNFDLLAL